MADYMVFDLLEDLNDYLSGQNLEYSVSLMLKLQQQFYTVFPSSECFVAKGLEMLSHFCCMNPKDFLTSAGIFKLMILHAYNVETPMKLMNLVRMIFRIKYCSRCRQSLYEDYGNIFMIEVTMSIVTQKKAITNSYSLMDKLGFLCGK